MEKRNEKPWSLPAGKHGTSWFWGLLRPGETGSDLAARVPDLPGYARMEYVRRWTKVTGGWPAIALVAYQEAEGLRVYSCVVGGRS
jgi:hypothetical protein